jgi:hypothetical protein
MDKTTENLLRQLIDHTARTGDGELNYLATVILATKEAGGGSTAFLAQHTKRFIDLVLVPAYEKSEALIKASMN